MRALRSPDSAAQTTAAPRTVDEYLAGVPEPARTTLNKIRATIRSVVPRETTEAITYRMPTFKYKGSLIAFAAFSDHCSVFPMGSGALEPLSDALKDYRTTKGTIRFRVDRPLPAALLKKVVRACIARNERKAH